MKILALSFFPAFVPPASGGEVRIYHFYRELSRSNQVVMISSGHLHSEIEEVWHSPTFREIRVPKDASFEHEWMNLEGHKGAGDLSGPVLLQCTRTPGLIHKKFLEEHVSADIIVHDFPFTINIDILAGIDNKPRVYCSHNCETELYASIHRNNPSKLVPTLVADAERKLLELADLVTYCSIADKNSFEKIVGRQLGNAYFIPNGITSVSRSQTSKGIGANKSAVFLGSAHLPNVDAATYICKDLAAELPEFTFHIVGNCLPEGDYRKNVVRHGLVSPAEKSRILSSASFAINPVNSGSGSSLKVLDFIAHSIPIISTTTGARGFGLEPDIHYFCAELENFADALVSAAKDPEQLSEIAKRASDKVMGDFSWQTISSRFEAMAKTAVASARTSGALSINDFDPYSSVGGGATRIRGLHAAIGENLFPIATLCFTDEYTIQAEKLPGNRSRLAIPKTSAHREREKYFSTRFHISANDVVAAEMVLANELFLLAYKTLSRSAQLIICEHPYLADLPLQFGHEYVYSSQNNESQLKSTLLKWHPDREYLVNFVANLERRAVEGSRLLIAVSQEDAESFSKGLSFCSPIVVVPNGADDPVAPSGEDLSKAGSVESGRSVVFLGSAHMPNVDAAQFIVNKLAHELPDLTFHIIGSVCDALPENLPPNIVKWGLTSPGLKSAILNSCTIAINPMLAGSGSNVKLADFLLHGLAVVSTSFGTRGYPKEVLADVHLSGVEGFATVLRQAIEKELAIPEGRRDFRRATVAERLTMKAYGRLAVEYLRQWRRPRKRMLFVTYRYTYPTRGGAEEYLSRLLLDTSSTGDFDIDVIAPEVSRIYEEHRFKSSYQFEDGVSAPFGSANLRYLRFPLADASNSADDSAGLVAAWVAQIGFERELYVQYLARNLPEKAALAWGWAPPQASGNSVARWAMVEAGLYVPSSGTLEVTGYNPAAATIRIVNDRNEELLHSTLDEYFSFVIDEVVGTLTFSFSVQRGWALPDLRPLGSFIQEIKVGGKLVDLGRSPVCSSPPDEASFVYQAMHHSAIKSRRGISLSQMRGPHSDSLENFIYDQVRSYDVVVTHNTVFRPTCLAIDAASRANVPTVVLPHSHFDDDFYHFEDVAEAALRATVVLASPRAACDFLENLGAKHVRYHSPGIGDETVPSTADSLEFRSKYNRDEPFFVILGRKAAAKGYMAAIDAISRVGERLGVRLLIIGPDDDGIEVSQPRCEYWGMQSRAIVNGALANSLALINMSRSESFGMVLLEAWQAGTAVIANRNCSAFRDIATDDVDALLVDDAGLDEAMTKLSKTAGLRDRLALAGRAKLNEFSWTATSRAFNDACIDAIAIGGGSQKN